MTIPRGPLWSQSDDDDLVRELTQIIRAADQRFESEGGSSRHWVRDCFLPQLNSAGFVVTRPRKGVT